MIEKVYCYHIYEKRVDIKMHKYILILSLFLLTSCSDVINEKIFDSCMEQLSKKPAQDVSNRDVMTCKNAATTLKFGP